MRNTTMLATGKQNGFGLVEAVTAIAVLGIAFSGLLASMVSILRLNKMSAEHALAANAANQTVEAVQSAVYSTIPGTYSNLGFDVPGLPAQDGDADGKPGLVTVDSTDPALYLVTVTVAWKSRVGNYRVRLDTKVANRSGS